MIIVTNFQTDLVNWSIYTDQVEQSVQYVCVCVYVWTITFE